MYLHCLLRAAASKTPRREASRIQACVSCLLPKEIRATIELLWATHPVTWLYDIHYFIYFAHEWRCFWSTTSLVHVPLVQMKSLSSWQAWFSLMTRWLLLVISIIMSTWRPILSSGLESLGVCPSVNVSTHKHNHTLDFLLDDGPLESGSVVPGPWCSLAGPSFLYIYLFMHSKTSEYMI